MSEGALGPPDEDHESFYAAAGRCIIGWSFIDRIVFDIFHTALGTDPVKASIIYYRSPSLSDHLTLTDKLVCASLTEGSDLRKRWQALKKRTDKLLPIRNKLAHHPITLFWETSDNGEREWLAYVEELRRYPHLDKMGRFLMAHERQINLAGLVEHHNATVSLREALLEFLESSTDELRKPAPELN